MSSNTKRRFFERNAAPTVASDDDFDAVFAPVTERSTRVSQDIPIERIRANPFQARAKFKDIELLADSMRTHGFTSRLRVRRDPEQPQFFQLVYGERRLRAAQAAGMTIIPCDVAEHTDAEMREIGLTENLQRSDLEPLEEARAFRLAIDRDGYSIRGLAAQIGKSKGYVQNRLDILRAPDDVLEMVDQHPETLTAALFIGQLATAHLRGPLIERVVRGELDKEAVRAIVKQIAASEALPTQAKATRQTAADAQHTDTPQAAGSMPTAHTRGSESSAATQRAVRQSSRALGRATQTLETMITQLQLLVPELQANERAELRDVLAERYLPAIQLLLRALDDARD